MNPQFYTKQKVDGLLSNKLGNTEQAADSAMLGGAVAEAYALKTDIPSKISQITNDRRFVTEDEVSSIRDTKTKIDSSGNVYAATRIYNGKFIRKDKSNGTTLEIPFTRVVESFGKDYEYQSTGGAITIVYSSGNGYLKINGSFVMEEPYCLDPQSGDDLGVYEDDSYVYEFQRAYANFPANPTDHLARESQLAEYALKTDIPTRVKNDADTVRIDGEGNVYALDVPKSMYFIVDRGWGGGTDLQEWTLYSSGNGVWKWSNNGAYSSNSYYITYDASAGTLSAYYESGGYNRTITVEKNLDPTAEGVDFGGLGGLTVAQYSCSYVPKTNQRSEPSEPTDRLARESQLPSKTSDLENDSGFVTKVDKLDNGVKKVDIDGKIYEATVQNVGGYYRYVKAGYTPGTLPYNPTYKSDDHFHFGGNLEDRFMRYFPSTGEIRMGWGSVYVTTAEKGLNPLAGDVLPDFEYEGWSYTFTAQAADFPEEPTDQFAKVSEIPDTSGFMKKTDVADNANSAKYLSGSEHRVDAEGKMYPAMGNYWVAYTTSGDRTWGKYKGKSGSSYTWECNSGGFDSLRYNADTGLVSWAGVYGGSGYADKNLDPAKDTIVIREYNSSGRTATHYGVGYSETADAQLLRGTVDGKFTDAQKAEIRAVIEEMYDNGETEAF